jgi:hypothetical protein
VFLCVGECCCFEAPGRCALLCSLSDLLLSASLLQLVCAVLVSCWSLRCSKTCPGRFQASVVNVCSGSIGGAFVLVCTFSPGSKLLSDVHQFGIFAAQGFGALLIGLVGVIAIEGTAHSKPSRSLGCPGLGWCFLGLVAFFSFVRPGLSGLRWLYV